MDDPGRRRRERSDTRRAEGFSDAVFAISITLLVLDLKPPAVQAGELRAGLLQEWPAYLAYVTSFLYIAVVWLAHEDVFGHIRWMDRGLHWANLGILFTTAVMPFPTAVVSDAIRRHDPVDGRAAVVLYAVAGLMLCASWLVFLHALRRRPWLLEEGVGTGFLDRMATRIRIAFVLYPTAAVLGHLAGPPVALLLFFALPVVNGGLYWLGVVARRT